MVIVFSNVYMFGLIFWVENFNIFWYLVEFWMVELEMVFCDLEGDMDLVEEFLKNIFKFVLESCLEDMEFFNKWIDNIVFEIVNMIINNNFERIIYIEVVFLLKKVDEKFEYLVEWGLDLQLEYECYLCEELFKKFVIVIDYLVKIKVFYMWLNNDSKIVRVMDVLVLKVGEIIGGFQREECLDVLEMWIDEQEINKEELWWYLDLCWYGIVFYVGFGLGFERVVQFMIGMGNI